MQRIRALGWKRIIIEAIPILLMALTVILDQLTKVYFRELIESQEVIWVIDGFFYLTYMVNTGALRYFLRLRFTKESYVVKICTCFYGGWHGR